MENYETLEELKLTEQTLSKLFKNQQAFSAAKRQDKGVGRDKFITALITDAGGFTTAFKEGVGRETLVKFLGGNWPNILI